MSLLEALLGKRTGSRRSRRDAQKPADVVIFGGQKRDRLIHHGPLNASLTSAVYVSISENGLAELVVSVTQGDKIVYKPSAGLPRPFEPIFALRMLRIVDLLEEINVGEPHFQDYATAYAVAKHPKDAPDDAIATYQNVRSQIGEAAFDAAVSVWPTAQEVEGAILVCTDNGIELDLEDVSQAAMDGHITLSPWLVRNGVEDPEVRRVRLAAEEAFLVGLQPTFDVVQKELDHGARCGCMEEMRRTAVSLRRKGITDTDIVVGIALVNLLQSNPMAQIDALSGGGDDNSTSHAVVRAASIVAKAPGAREERALRWAIAGTAVEIGAGMLPAKKDDKK